jgi:transposase
MSDNLKRRAFTEEFKKDAVKLVLEQGYSNSEVGRRLGVHGSNISRWVRQHRNKMENPNEGASRSPQDLETENKRLKKENKRLLMEREILKKAAAFFANESK